MISLVLHLRGPMQAWGGNSRLDIRSTELLPTKSALVGILASAHGRTHGSDVSDLVQLEMVIRVDQPGWLMRDYHTVGAGYPKGQRIQKAKGGERPEDKSTLVSERYYLADAAFTITLPVACIHFDARQPQLIFIHHILPSVISKSMGPP